MRTPLAARWPPSISKTAPVVKAASSEAKKEATPAISPGSAMRLAGMASSTRSWIYGVCHNTLENLVFTKPGAMALTVMPVAPSSTANARVIITTAAFEQL